jgi:hypothetical protein
MTTTTITLTVAKIEEKAVPPQNNQLGNMLAFDENITKINGNTGLTGRHSGFCVRVQKPEIWLCEAGWRLPGIPGTPFPNGGQLQARGLLDFNIDTGTVAITGGTDDYLRASGHMKFNKNDYTLTIETP